MKYIVDILKEVELHDSSLVSFTALGDGSVHLALDLDDVWNKQLSELPKGIAFHSVYEVSEFKIDRLNIIGSVEVKPLPSYDRTFVTDCATDSTTTTEVHIEFVAGGSLRIICSGTAECIF